MELTKSQRALLAMPSRWPSIVLGITFSLFISAIFTSNFAAHIVPSASAGSGSSRSSSSTIWPAPTPVFINTLSSQLFFIFFRNPNSNAASYEDSSSSMITGAQRQAFATPVPMVHDAAAGHSTTSDHAVKGQYRISKATKDEELLHRSKLQPSEADVSPRTKHLNGGSLCGGCKFRSTWLSKSSPPLDTGKPLKKSATSSFDEESGKTISKSATEHEDNRSTVPGSRNISKPLQVASETLLLNTTSAAQLRKGLPYFLPRISHASAKQYCDISVGQWVEDDSYPLYQPGTCLFVDEAFSCQRNGRPDSKYTRLRWAPRDCIVPRFNGTDLLERLRGKRLVFVGDSLNRNQWESMLCMLRESLPDKRRIMQIHGGRISKLPGAYVFKFVDYECKVEFYTSQYLVDKLQDGTNPNQFTIRLDKMDKSERRWRKANVLVFNTGHWWTSDKIGEGDNRFQEGSIVHPKLDVGVAYNKALSTWAKWVDTHVNFRSTMIFFRGYSPVHYMGGQWNSGGQCQDETEPIFNESFLTRYPRKMRVLEGILHEMKLHVQVLNITRLSEYRKDAHPATYGHAPHHVVRHQDCSHWCLPGLPDVWNELLYFFLKQEF